MVVLVLLFCKNIFMSHNHIIVNMLLILISKEQQQNTLYFTISNIWYNIHKQK